MEGGNNSDSTAMSGRHLLGFHATRLLDLAQVQSFGLVRLDIERQVGLVKRCLLQVGAIVDLGALDAALDKLQALYAAFTNREGSVWATPVANDVTISSEQQSTSKP